MVFLWEQAAERDRRVNLALQPSCMSIVHRPIEIHDLTPEKWSHLIIFWNYFFSKSRHFVRDFDFSCLF